MAKQSRVGMLIALLLLFMFGLVLSGLTDEETVVSPEKAGVADSSGYIRPTQPRSISVTHRQTRRTRRTPDLTAGQMLEPVERTTPQPAPAPRRVADPAGTAYP